MAHHMVQEKAMDVDLEKHAQAISHEKSNNGTEHHEDSSIPETLLDTEITYDNNGISGIVRSPYVFGAALLASFGGFSFGYDQGVISIILTMTQFREQYPETDLEHPHYGFNTGFMTGYVTDVDI